MPLEWNDRLKKHAYLLALIIQKGLESLRMGIETGARLDWRIYPDSGDALTPCLSDFEKKRRDRSAVQWKERLEGQLHSQAVALPRNLILLSQNFCKWTIDIVYVIESAAYAVIFRVVCVKARTSEVRASDGFWHKQRVNITSYNNSHWNSFLNVTHITKSKSQIVEPNANLIAKQISQHILS